MKTNDEYRTKGAKEGIGKRRDNDHIQNNDSGPTSTIRKNVQKGGGYAHDPDTWLAIGNLGLCFPRWEKRKRREYGEGTGRYHVLSGEGERE